MNTKIWMTKNKNQQFDIILEYIKDLSIETPGANTLLSVRENLKNYVMDIDISSLTGRYVLLFLGKGVGGFTRILTIL